MVPGKYEGKFKTDKLRTHVTIWVDEDFLCIFCPMNMGEHMPTSVCVMTWCCQAGSHRQNQCSSRSIYISSLDYN